MAALHALPHLQRLVVSAVVGVGQPGGKATTERTVAQQLHLSQAMVRALREEGLRRLRELLTGPTPAVARTGAVREQACRDAPAGTRPNRRAAPCTRCRRRVPPGQGHLQVAEKGTRKTYTVTCAPTCPQP
jgi:hypothetical protein